jgi:TolB-like protein
MDSGRWQEIQATFDELVALDQAARARRLTALGATDPALRRAVEVLLAADAEADQRLATLEAAFLSPAMPAPDPLSLAGRTISHFRVLEPLGAGGMGVVYRAEDTRLGRAVALKFLLPQLSLDASAKARFLQEAHSAAALDHPNLCTIHEVGESDDGRLFLAMALYPGETLMARLDRDGPLPVVEAIEIARQIAEGLAYAHTAGIVHRDLKPGNVMLVRDGPVKILDFGLAKARDQSLSSVSARMGTVVYMAPEQIRGEAVDARTDLWALGVVLYEMLTGRRPFAGDHELAVVPAILDDEPVPLSTLRAEVPAAVEDLVLMLLQKDPAKRYPAAAQVLLHLADSTVRPVKPRSRRARRVLSGKRAWAVAVGAAAVGIAGVLVVAALLARHGAGDTGVASRVVVMPFENRTAVTELDPLGTMAAEWVTQGLTEVPFLTVLDTRSAQATARILDAAGGLVAVGRETGADVVVSGSYFLRGDSLQLQAQIASTGDGSILLGIGGVTAPRDRPLEGIEQVRQRVAAGLASLLDRDVTSFQIALRQPPTYAAYREYVEGLESYMGGSPMRESARHFLQAVALDSTFLTARVWAAQSGTFAVGTQEDEALVRRADSLISQLQLLRYRLAPFDRARLDFLLALRAHDYLEAYRAALGLVAASPGSVDARREAALSALRVLRPREALRRLGELNPERGLMRNWGEYWFVVTWAHHLLGQHEEELALARRGRQLYGLADPLGDPGYLYLELRALAALGRITELDSIARAQLPSAAGQAGLIGFAIAGELMAHGHAEAAHRLAQYASDHPGTPPPSEQQAARQWLYQHRWTRVQIGDPHYRGEHLEVQSLAARAGDEWAHWRAETALLLGDVEIAASRAAELRDPAAHGLLFARILAAQGRLGAARAALARWEGSALQARGDLRGLEMERASVLVRLGDVDRALEVLAEGLGRGAIFNATMGQDGHAYADLAPLWSNPRFRALIKPRG